MSKWGDNFVIYGDITDERTLEQFYSAMELPTTVKGALMPDAHAGYSLPIGAVVATDRMVYPSWVGYDIGCGMCAVPTSFDVGTIREDPEAIRDDIYERIPVGFNHHDEAQVNYMQPRLLTTTGHEIFEDKGGYKQLGTLGGGNHFIEIGVDKDKTVWITVHSGSRGIGHGIATHYMRLAAGGKAREGHYGFNLDTDEARMYMLDHSFCLEFARVNRLHMVQQVAEVLATHCCGGEPDYSKLINRHHNHAEYRPDYGWVIHRKGATHAEQGMMGVIPGNMRDGLYIVRGKGNAHALWSSSHGAGRTMSRREARDSFNASEVYWDLWMLGITVPGDMEKYLDEAPDAYKNLREVMEHQTDLVDIVTHVRPIISVKG